MYCKIHVYLFIIGLNQLINLTKKTDETTLKTKADDFLFATKMVIKNLSCSVVSTLVTLC